MYIPDDKIAAIRDTADIVDIVSEVVRLKKAGKNYLGLCPFHSEKTPSFTVNREKQIFHCFGCHEGGNVFSFLMKYQGISFPEAARMLARRYNIEIPSAEASPAQKKAASEKEKLREVNRQAAEFFHACLKDGRLGKKALAYLENRGITSDICDTFQLGFAPAGWDNLIEFFRKKKVPLTLVEKAGLIAAKQGGGYYDRFRDRVIFPIQALSGEVIGFGGRVMDDTLPKYLNSPETPIYNKRRTLFGLNRTKQNCRSARFVYLTEGYMDFLALYRCGIKNTVATLGTSLTAEQVRLLKGQVDRVILLYDSDAAGIKAAQRAVAIFNQEKGLEPYILTLPEGHDPDSYLRDHGVEKFQKIAETAQNAVRFLIESAINQHGLSVEGKLRVVADMQDHLAMIEDSVARDLYVKTLAERLGIDERAVRERVNKALAGQRKSEQRTGRAASADGDGRRPDAGKTSNASREHDRLERQIVAMMLHVPDLLGEIETHGVLDFFENPALKTLGNNILANRKLLLNPENDLTVLAEDEEQRNVITSILLGSEFSEPDISGCRKLLAQFLKRRYRQQDELSKKIKTAEENKDDDLLEQLLKEKQKQIQARENINRA